MRVEDGEDKERKREEREREIERERERREREREREREKEMGKRSMGTVTGERRFEKKPHSVKMIIILGQKLLLEWTNLCALRDGSRNKCITLYMETKLT